MATVRYNLVLPLTISALSEAHAAVLTAGLLRIDPIAYTAEGTDPLSPLGEYRVESGVPEMVPVLSPEPTLPWTTTYASEEQAKRNRLANAQVEAIVAVPPPEAPPAPAPTKESPAKERRRCTKEWPDSDLVTAGISPKTIAEIESLVETRNDIPTAKALLEEALTRFSRPSLTVLREEEGRALAEALGALPGVCPAPEVSPDSDAASERWPDDYPPLGIEVATKFGNGIVQGLAKDEQGKGSCLVLQMVNGDRAGQALRFYPSELIQAEPTESEPKPCTSVTDPGQVYQNKQEDAPAPAVRPPWLR